MAAAVAVAAQPDKDAYARAERFGRVRVGDAHVFASGITGVRWLPIDDIAWAYMRKEDSRITCGCCAGTLSTYALVLYTAGGRSWKIDVERKPEAEHALAAIARRNPRAETGYSAELAQKYAVQLESA